MAVGVEPVDAGDFTIEEGSVFNADQTGAGASGTEQYSGTINLGQTLIIKTGGKVFLNQDTLNAKGRTGSSADSMRMSGDSFLDAYLSNLTFKDTMSVEHSSMALNGGTFNFGNKLFVRNSGMVTMTDVTASHQDLGNAENMARVVVESNSSMTLANSSLDLVSGSGDVNGQNILIKSGGNVLVTGAASNINAKKVTSDNSGSLYNQTGGSLTTYGISSGDSGDIQLKDTTVTSDYISALGSFSAKDSTLNLRNSLGATQNLSSSYDGTVSLINTTVDIVDGGIVDLRRNAALTTTGATITAEKLLLMHAAKATIDTSIINVKNFSATGIKPEATNPDPSTLNDTKNTITINSSDVHIEEFFDLGAEGGSGSKMTLTASNLDAKIARILNGSDVTADSSHITLRDNANIVNSNVNLNNTSSISFEDELFINASGSLNLVNSTLAHQNDTDAIDENRGSIIVEDSSLNLTGSTVDLSGGDEQRINIKTQGKVTADNSNITAKEVNIDGISSFYHQTGGSLTADKFISTNQGEIQLNGTTVNADSFSVLSESAMTSKLSTLLFKDGGLINDSTMDLDGGTFNFGNKLFVRDSGVVTMTDVTASHQDLGNTENMARVVVESNSSMTLANSSLDLVSGSGDINGQNILIKSGGNIEVTGAASNINAKKVTSDNSGSLYKQTGGSLTTYGISSGDSGDIQLKDTTLTSDYISVLGNFSAKDSTLNLRNSLGATQNLSSSYDGTVSLINTTVDIVDGGIVDLRRNAELTTTGASITAEKLLLMHAAQATIDTSIINVKNFLATGVKPEATNPDPSTLNDTKNTITINSSDVHIEEFFDLGAEGGSGSKMTLTASNLDAKIARILNGSDVTADLSHITLRDNANIVNSNVTLKNTSSISFENELFINASGSLDLVHSTLAHQDDTDIVDENRGSIIVNDSSLNLTGSTVDLSGGDEQRIKIKNQGKVTATDSTITAKEVVINDAGSKMEISNSTTLTTDSLTVQDSGIFTAENSDVLITGNTTTIETGGQMFINGGSYEEAGNFIINDGTLKAEDVAINIGNDMIISGDSIIEVGELFIGDDFLNDITGSGFFSSTMITMMGTMDDEEDGHFLKSNALLEGLSITGSVDIVLMGDLIVENLIISDLGSIDLNGHSLEVSSFFSGNIEQIIVGEEGLFNYDPGQAVPEPSTFFLMGLGLIFVLKTRDKFNI